MIPQSRRTRPVSERLRNRYALAFALTLLIAGFFATLTGFLRSGTYQAFSVAVVLLYVFWLYVGHRRVR